MELLAEIVKALIMLLAVGAVSLLVAFFFGWVVGSYLAAKEWAFRKRALRLYGENGQIEDFLILAGDPALVSAMYRVAVATGRRAEATTTSAAERQERIRLSEQKDEQDTDGPRAA